MNLLIPSSPFLSLGTPSMQSTVMSEFNLGPPIVRQNDLQNNPFKDVPRCLPIHSLMLCMPTAAAPWAPRGVARA